MTSIREIVDPNGTLPSVVLLPYADQKSEFSGLRRIKMTINMGEEVVGWCDIVLETSPSAYKAHFDGVKIDKDKRGRGVGMATYLQAIELAHDQGLPFETQDYDQTVHAKTIWDKLAQLGVAEVITPFQPSKIKKGRFIGKYRVIAIND